MLCTCCFFSSSTVKTSALKLLCIIPFGRLQCSGKYRRTIISHFVLNMAYYFKDRFCYCIRIIFRYISKLCHMDFFFCYYPSPFFDRGLLIVREICQAWWCAIFNMSVSLTAIFCFIFILFLHAVFFHLPLCVHVQMPLSLLHVSMRTLMIFFCSYLSFNCQWIFIFTRNQNILSLIWKSLYLNFEWILSYACVNARIFTSRLYKRFLNSIVAFHRIDQDYFKNVKLLWAPWN